MKKNNYNSKDRFRRICFTLNNYTENDEKQFKKNYDNKIISYIIYGYEIGPNNGTPHLQGYIEFSKQLYFGSIKTICPSMHFERAKGNAGSNIKYCSKDENTVEYGKPKEQGKRNDLEKIKTMVKENKPMSEILDECTNFQQMRCAEKLIQYKKLDIKTRNIPEVIYIHGKSGTGKTEYAHKICDEKSTYCINDKMDWFDGYDMDNDVIINDFRSSKCEYSKLLNLMDGYQMRVPIKGGFTIWQPKRIIFTSTIHPTNLYKGMDKEDTLYQLLRRITKFIVMDKNYKDNDKTNDYKKLIKTYNK